MWHCISLVPIPTSVIVTPPVVPVTVGSSINLTCTIELSQLVDVPVTVNTVWTGPDGFMTANTTRPVMGSTAAYTSTATVSSFGRKQSGVYTCTTNISSTSPFLVGSIQISGTARVTVGKSMRTSNINDLVMHLQISVKYTHRCLPLSEGDSLC